MRLVVEAHVTAMYLLQQLQQGGNFLVTDKQQPAMLFARHPRTAQLTADTLFNHLQLFLQQLRQPGLLLQLRPGQQAVQHRKGCFQGMAQIAGGTARAFQLLVNMCQQMIDLPDQRLHFLRYLPGQLAALATFQLPQLLSGLLQRFQRPANQPPLQQADDQQCQCAPGQPPYTQALETLQQRLIILGHGHQHVAVIQPVTGLIAQQLLLVRTGKQLTLRRLL